MYNSGMNLKVHNNYKFELIDAATGKVKQMAKAENVVCNSFYTGNNLRNYINRVRLGTGTGTPAATDTALFTHKYTLSGSETSERINDTTIRITITATSPLGNTGDYTEVGLGQNSLLSHALITDAEGNPITITQTSTDILSITAYVYMSLTFTDTTFTYPVRPSALLHAAYQATYDTTYSTSLFSTSSVRVYLTDCVHTKTPNSVDSMTMNTSVYVDSASGAAARIGVSSGNIGYYNYLVIGITGGAGGRNPVTMPVGFIALPNSATFAPYSATGLPIGTGDGSTTAFKIPLDLFIEDSDVVYVNGTAKTRDTDYTIDNNTNNNKRKCISAGNFAKYTASSYSGSVVNGVLAWFATTAQTMSTQIITKNGAMIIDLSELTDTRVNCIRLPRLGYYYDGIPASISSFTGTVTLEHSDDGQTYTAAATVQYVSGIPQTPEITFANAVEKDYWRITTDFTGSTYVCAYSGENTTNSFFGYTEAYALNFTVAPAADAVITMSCSLDRPYKSSNYVIDLAGTITMSNG